MYLEKDFYPEYIKNFNNLIITKDKKKKKPAIREMQI